MNSLTIVNDDNLTPSDRAYAALTIDEETLLSEPHVWVAVEDADSIASILLTPYKAQALAHWLTAWCEAHPEVHP